MEALNFFSASLSKNKSSATKIYLNLGEDPSDLGISTCKMNQQETCDSKGSQVASFRNTFEKRGLAKMAQGNIPPFQIWHVSRNGQDLFHCKFTGSYSKMCPATESSCSISRWHRSFVSSLCSFLQSVTEWNVMEVRCHGVRDDFIWSSSSSQWILFK